MGKALILHKVSVIIRLRKFGIMERNDDMATKTDVDKLLQ